MPPEMNNKQAKIKIKALRDKIVIATYRNTPELGKNKKHILSVFADKIDIAVDKLGTLERNGIKNELVESICDELGVDKYSLVKDSLLDFSRKLGVQRHELKEVIGFKYTYFDFYCREYKPDRVEKYFNSLCGVYELWHCSMTYKPDICKSFFSIDTIDIESITNTKLSPKDAIIRCSNIYNTDDYSGHILLTRHHLIALLDSMKTRGELVTMYIDLPFDQNRIEYLYGISIGLDIKSKIACATKLVFKKIAGKEDRKECIEHIHRMMLLKGDNPMIRYKPDDISDNLKNALHNSKPSDLSFLYSSPPECVLKDEDFPNDEIAWVAR